MKSTKLVISKGIDRCYVVNAVRGGRGILCYYNYCYEEKNYELGRMSQTVNCIAECSSGVEEYQYKFHYTASNANLSCAWVGGGV